MVRAQNLAPIDTSLCDKFYQTLNLSEEVDLGYAGRMSDGNSSLKAIEQLSAGDPLKAEGGQRSLSSYQSGMA